MRRVKQFFQNFARRGELIIPLSFLAVSIYLFYLATQFPTPIRFMHQVGPDIFPKILLGTMMVLSVKLTYDALKRGSLTEFEKVVNPRNLWVTFAFILAYVFLLETVGFVVLTPIWIAAYMASIGVRRWTWLLGGTVIFSAFLILVFPALMHILLPRGVGLFREISLLVY